jgi:hypothetical protein
MSQTVMTALIGVGLIVGVLGLPRRPGLRWILAVVVLGLTTTLAVVAPRALGQITFFTAPIISLLLAGAIGGTCAAVAFLLPDRSWWPRGGRGREIALLCAGLMADLVLLSWVRDPLAIHPDYRASIAASLQVLFFAPIALLQAGYMRDLQGREERGRQRGRMTKEELDFGKVVWSRLIGLGLPLGVLILSLVAEVVAHNGLDRQAGPRGWDLLPLGVAFGMAWIALLAVRLILHRPSCPTEVLQLPLRPALLVTFTLTWTWPVAYYLSHDFNADIVGYAAFMALMYGAATAHSLWFHAAGEHLARLSRGTLSIAGLAGLMSSLMLFWLLSCALWARTRPLQTPGAVPVVVLVLLGNGMLVWMIGSILAVGRTVENRAGYTTEQNLAGDLVSYAGFAVILGVLPTMMLGHLRYLPKDESVLFVLVPGLLLTLAVLKLGGVIYRTVHENLVKYRDYGTGRPGLKNVEEIPASADHVRRRKGFLPALSVSGMGAIYRRVSEGLIRYRDYSEGRLDEKNIAEDRAALEHFRRVQNHFRFQEVVALIAMLVSFAWLLWVSARSGNA